MVKAEDRGEDVKSLGELMFDLKEDPEKERIRQKSLSKARAWEESVLPEQDGPGAGASLDDPLLQRLARALPQLNATQRHMLATLLDSWGH